MSGRPAMRVDAHAHVFERGLPLAAGRRYAPAYDAPLPAYLARLDALGLSHGVLVQPSFLGTDNGYLLAALAASPARLRGIAVVDSACGRAELDRLAAGGVVGLRLNLIGGAVPDFADARVRDLLRQASDLGVKIEVQCEARRIGGVLPALLAAGVVVMVDHFGLPDPALGRDDPDWRALLERAAETPMLRLKLSGSYRLGPNGDVLARQLAPLLREAFTPRRLVFGTDWPHTRYESDDRAADALAALAAWLPDRAEREVCLGAAAGDLFGFPTT